MSVKKNIILIVLLIISVIAAGIFTSVYAEEHKEGDVLYECDFEDGMPADLRVVKGGKSNAYVEDGFLYLTAQEKPYVRVLLPEYLDSYGNVEITMHATILEEKDGDSWGAIIYRAQIDQYPYYQMCFHQNATASNGIEFARRTEWNSWSVTSTGSYTENITSDKLFEFSCKVSDDHAIYSVNGTPIIDSYDATMYSEGGIGIQASYCVLKVDDIKVTYQSPEKKLLRDTNIAQPDLGVIGGYALSEYVTDAESLSRITNAEIKPANAIFYVNSELKVTDAEGKNAFSDLQLAMESLGGVIMPTLYVKDEATVNAVCKYLNDNLITDVFVMSDKDELVLKARNGYDLCRGVLDLTKELDGKSLSETELLAVRGRANSAHATIVVLPDTAATQSGVKYIYDRLVAVWVSSTKPVTTVTQAYRILSCGGYGAITDNTEFMYKTATEQMSGNKLFRTPLNIGHRGIPDQAPENTIEGCKLAIELGADVVENDIYLTSDGYIVIMHDTTSGRTCNENLNITGSTLEELRKLYVNKQYPNKEGFTECRIPTLEEYYENFKGQDVQIFVELKGGTEELVEKFTEMTKAYGMEGQVSVITFNESQIQNLHKHFPEMSAGYLCGSIGTGDDGVKQAINVLRKIQPLASTYNPSYGGHTAQFTYNANMRGILTWPWTVDSVTDYADLFMWGMNGMTTNNCTIPAEFAKLLTSESNSYTLEEGQTLEVKATLTTYERNTFNVGSKVRVIPLEGAITVGEGNLLSFEGTGKFTYALEYEYKASNIDYTIYTEPVTVTIKGENQGLSVGAIVAICAAAVVLAGVIVVVLKKKK